MKKQLIAILLVLLVPASAAAADVDELLAIAAMPLAVAAVADLADVPARDLADVVTAMNRARVPAPQFIEVVRYVPVALVEPAEPRFVTFVTNEVDRGLTGSALALAMEDRIETYGVTDIDVVGAPEVVVVEENFLPPVVVTRFQPLEFDPVALVAMPLAVAAVADLADIPLNEFASFVRLLNQAAVPAPQFIEVVRYAPVAFVDPVVRPQFVTYVRTRFDDGITGFALAQTIEDRIELLGVDEIRIVEPPIVTLVEQAQYIPPVVATHVATVRSGHPHGGPPGQLKKQLGLQTGAEVVHGARPPVTRVVERDGADRDEVRRDRAERRKRVVADRAGDRPRKQREVRVRGNDGGGKKDRVVVTKERRDVAKAPKPQRVERVRVERPRPQRVESPKVESPRGNRGGGGGGQGNSGGGKGHGKGKGK